MDRKIRLQPQTIHDTKIKPTKTLMSNPQPTSAKNAPFIDQARQALTAIRHFTSLPEKVQLAIARCALPSHFTPEQVIFLEGEPPDRLYILEHGWVKSIRMSREGREQAIMFMGPGELFGDVAVFTGTNYPGTVIALEAVDVFTIEQKLVWKLIAEYPELAAAVIHRLGERILHFIGLVEDLSLRNVESRVAHTLLLHVQVENGQLVVPRRSWTTLDEMAARLGTVRDVLGRTLRSLEEKGLLRIERDSIVIIDPQKLTELGEI
jgi:CRP-like cAMP-binding protein